MAKASGISFSKSPEVTGKVTTDMSNVTVGQVLDAVLRDHGWRYRLDPSGRIIRVVTEAQYQKEAVGDK